MNKTEKIFQTLDTLGITFEKLEHQPIMTMHDGEHIARQFGITACKSLLMCNRQKRFFMILLPESKKLSASNVASQLNSTHLSFASPYDMERLLCASPGSVSILGLLFDTKHQIQPVIDHEILSQPYIGCHPCVNTCSLKIKTEDILNTFIPATGHDFITVK